LLLSAVATLRRHSLARYTETAARHLGKHAIVRVHPLTMRANCRIAREAGSFSCFNSAAKSRNRFETNGSLSGVPKSQKKQQLRRCNPRQITVCASPRSKARTAVSTTKMHKAARAWLSPCNRQFPPPHLPQAEPSRRATRP
jgi:hypothetical protein